MKHLKFLLFCSFFSALAFVVACSSDSDNDELPTVTTSEIIGIGNTTAISGGMVTNDGDIAVTARGVCWSTNPNPTIADSKTTDGEGIGSFISNITGLTANTTYYLRAYATNSAGTAYGNQLSFTTTNVSAPGTTYEYIIDITHDRDGNNTVTNGGHTTCMFIDGALIDMDSYAVSYTVTFYDMSRSREGATTTYPPDATYSFSADAGMEILNGVQGNSTYTNWYNTNNIGTVTRITPENKLFVMISWCTTSDCIDDCYWINGKARITVHY